MSSETVDQLWTVLPLLAAALLLFEAIRTHRRLRRAIVPAAWPPRPPAYPPVSVIRPIRGLDHGAAENIRAALQHGYPGEVETLFVFDDELEPALPLVRKAIAAMPPESQAPDDLNRARVVFAGAPPQRRTGKLNAMMAGLEHARHDLIVFADSDIRPARGALTALVDTLLAGPDVGSAFAPVVVTSPPETAGDAGYALLLNGLYAPAACQVMGRSAGRSSFIMGQFMALRRAAIERIGGLRRLEGQLVDDMYLGELITRAGLRNQLSPQSVPVLQSGLDRRGFWRIYRRWVAFSSSGLHGGWGDGQGAGVLARRPLLAGAGGGGDGGRGG